MTTDIPKALDWIFQSNNALEIPTLRLDRMATAVMAPTGCWGTVSRRDTKNVNTWQFYSDDYRFEKLWKAPEDIVATNCKVCVEPNFSSLDEMPFPVGWFNIYRKRWIARWWQEQGIDVIADLYVGEKYASWNFLGLPEGWRSFATRGSAETPEAALEVFEQASAFAGTRDILFWVYGGGIPQAKVLRAAGIPVVVSDYYRDQNASRWLTSNTTAGLLASAGLTIDPSVDRRKVNHGQK